MNIAYSAIINIVGVFFVAVATIVSTPFLIENMGGDGFALFRLILVSLISVTYLIDLGLSGVVRRILGSAINRQDFVVARKILFNINALYLVFGCIAGISILVLGFIMKSKIDVPLRYHDEYDAIIFFAAIYIFLLFFQSVCNSILMIYNRFLKYQIVVSGAKIAQLFLLIILIPLFQSKLFFCGLITIVVFLTFYLLSVFFVLQEWSDFSLKLKFDTKVMKSIKGLIGHNFVVSLCPVVIFYLNDFVVASNLSIVLLSIYTIAMLVTNQIKTILSSMLSPLFTLVNKLESKSEGGLNIILQNSLILTIVVWALLVFPLFFSVDSIIKLWVGPDFEASVYIVQINLIGTIGLVFYLIAYNFLNASGRISSISSISFITVVIYVVMLILGHFLEIYSLTFFALVFTFSLIFRGVASLFIVNKVFNAWNYQFLIELCKLTVVLCFIIIASYFIRQYIDTDQMMGLILYYMIFYFIMFVGVFLLLSKKQKKQLFKALGG